MIDETPSHRDPLAAIGAVPASRRSMLTGGVKVAGAAGLAMAVGGAAGLGVRRAFALDATPASGVSTIGGSRSIPGCKRCWTR